MGGPDALSKYTQTHPSASPARRRRLLLACRDHGLPVTGCPLPSAASLLKRSNITVVPRPEWAAEAWPPAGMTASGCCCEKICTMLVAVAMASPVLIAETAAALKPRAIESRPLPTPLATSSADEAAWICVRCERNDTCSASSLNGLPLCAKFGSQLHRCTTPSLPTSTNSRPPAHQSHAAMPLCTPLSSALPAPAPLPGLLIGKEIISPKRRCGAREPAEHGRPDSSGLKKTGRATSLEHLRAGCARVKRLRGVWP
mmetsp:Transcript_40888/g.65829  ORF Transcript_40888/g.65829 Transcript_40888/m.65829 type:complete len:257 (-) Transcript_40888:1882-2652(-)